jgi:uncharacterized protein
MDAEDIYVAPCMFGLGLFAKRAFEENEQILQFSGRTISFCEAVSLGTHEANALQVGPAEYVELESPGVYANHSCNPNAGVMRDRWLVAMRPIEAGEEIRYDYSTTVWEDHWSMRCACGEANCRGVIDDFYRLPIDVQDRYIIQNVVQRFILLKLEQLHSMNGLHQKRSAS